MLQTTTWHFSFIDDRRRCHARPIAVQKQHNNRQSNSVYFMFSFSMYRFACDWIDFRSLSYINACECDVIMSIQKITYNRLTSRARAHFHYECKIGNRLCCVCNVCLKANPSKFANSINFGFDLVCRSCFMRVYISWACILLFIGSCIYSAQRRAAAIDCTCHNLSTVRLFAHLMVSTVYTKKRFSLWLLRCVLCVCTRVFRKQSKRSDGCL